MTEVKSCCLPKSEKPKGILSGIVYGLIPHSFCIAFILFSIFGATVATSFFKKFLLLPYFFEILIGISLLFATISSAIYLKRIGFLSWSGMKNKWRYLLAMYGTTVAINLLLFLVIFPLTANLRAPKLQANSVQGLSSITLRVQIPCSGHASLIIDEINALGGIAAINFQMPNRFLVSFDSSRVTPAQITSLSVFKTYPAEIVGQ